jgi:glycosyltransferase involved in cell wall biosynthesis
VRVAIVHEWLESYAGSERVLEQMLACYPQADLFAVCDFLPDGKRDFLAGRRPRTSFIQKLPFAQKRFRWYLGLMPLAMEQLDLTGYDLVLSSHHAVAKGVITGPDQLHLSYVHSPMRYAWDLQHQYLREAKLERGVKGAYTRMLLSRMRAWDRSSANGVDVFLANSSYIARRVNKVYRRNAAVLYPPVDLDRFSFCAMKGDTYLVAGRQVPYKRVDLIVEAFRRMPGRKLRVVGDGPEAPKIAAIAAGAPNITLGGAVDQPELVRLMQQAPAVLFGAEEDFGITMVEAQSCGTPVIGYGAGGAWDIVRVPKPGTSDGGRPTGLLFDHQTPESVIAAVEKFEASRGSFQPESCRHNAERFSIEKFRTGLLQHVAQAMVVLKPNGDARPFVAGMDDAQQASAA